MFSQQSWTQPVAFDGFVFKFAAPHSSRCLRHSVMSATEVVNAESPFYIETAGGFPLATRPAVGKGRESSRSSLCPARAVSAHYILNAFKYLHEGKRLLLQAE